MAEPLSELFSAHPTTHRLGMTFSYPSRSGRQGNTEGDSVIPCLAVRLCGTKRFNFLKEPSQRPVYVESLR
ncbi:hypothetical protein TNCV_3971221 [Trichonephila clavipes]|nr:hypothetical protein TNCV_3971221 [Trichonephila clavipes]